MNSIRNHYCFSLLPWQVNLVCFVCGIFSIFAFWSFFLFLGVVLLSSKLNNVKVSWSGGFLFFLIGLVFINTLKPFNHTKSVVPEGKIFVKARIKKVTLATQNRLKIIVDDIWIYKGKRARSLKGKGLWVWQDFLEIPSSSQIIAGKAVIKEMDGYLNPYSKNRLKYWHFKEIKYRIYSFGRSSNIKFYGEPSLIHKIRLAFRSKILSMAPNTQGRALLLSLILGDRSCVSYSTINLIREASLSHCFALSGMHLGFMVMIGWLLVWILGCCYPKVFLRVPRQDLLIVVSFPLVFFYLFLNYHIPSLVRAALMFVFLSLMFIFKRPGFLIDGVFLSLLTFALFFPMHLFEASLQLSYAATFSIAVFYPYVNRAFCNVKNKLFRFLLLTFGISIVANIGVFPLLCFFFGKVSPSIYLNVIWIPVIGWITIPSGLLGLFFSFIPALSVLAKSFFYISTRSLDILITLLYELKRYHLIGYFIVPRIGWIEVLGFWTLVMGVYLCFVAGRKNLLIPVIGFLMMVSPFLNTKLFGGKSFLKITVFDVGNGESYLIRTKDGKRILINGGGTKSRSLSFGEVVLSPALTFRQTPSLDSIILTYPRYNRLRGLYFLMDHYKIGNFVWAGDLPKNRWDRAQLLGRINRFDVIKVSDKKRFCYSNNLSLIIFRQFYLYNSFPPLWVLLKMGSRDTVLFVSKLPEKLGLAEVKVNPEFLVVYMSRTYDISRLVSFCKALKPKVVLISCGSIRLFNMVKASLNRLKIKAFSTSTEGFIQVSWESDGVKVKGFNKVLYFVPDLSHKVN